jgi:hypothetical protein
MVFTAVDTLRRDWGVGFLAGVSSLQESSLQERCLHIALFVFVFVRDLSSDLYSPVAASAAATDLAHLLPAGTLASCPS